jgi:hypothetical protein
MAWLGLVLLSAAAAPAGERAVFISEKFASLDAWRPLTFPKIKEHSTYTAVKEGDLTFLKAESKASASGIVSKGTFDVRVYDRMSWRWKVDNVYEKGDATTKAGDDYPIRVFILFAYDPSRASFGQRLKYGTAKLLYGEYPPDSGLSYVWASREAEHGIYTNPFTDREKEVVLRAGKAGLGTWVAEEVNILEDYRKAFGTDPPAVAGVAVMNDSDNTGEAAVSYLTDLEVYRNPPSPPGQ